MENNELWKRISQGSVKTESVIRGMTEKEGIGAALTPSGQNEDMIDAVMEMAFERVQVGMIDISRVQSFMDYPFDTDGSDIAELAADIRKNGMERPVIVRRIADEKYDYEMIDGHRRAYALRKAGHGLADAYILDCSDDEAAVILCEYNLKVRTDMKLSEQSRVFGMELDALKRIVRNGILAGNHATSERSDLPGEKTSRAVLAVRHGLSAVNMSRIIRLKELEKGLLEAVDSKKLPFNVAVALTHLRAEEQEITYRLISDGLHISLADAEKLKKQAQSRLEPMSVYEIEMILGKSQKDFGLEKLLSNACEIVKKQSTYLSEDKDCSYDIKDANKLAVEMLRIIENLKSASDNKTGR